MGCTRNYSLEDYRQSMQSVGRQSEIPLKPLTKERRNIIRALLNKTSSQTVLKILADPNHRAHEALRVLLVKTVTSKMSTQEQKQFPNAYHTILSRHPDAMGLFAKPPKHRGPGASAVQHHYEIFSAAALMTKNYTTTNGKDLSIALKDRVDFGIKVAHGYAQPKRYGTIEADILVHKNSLWGNKTVGIDSKFSEKGRYDQDVSRQLEGIRTGFRDGKLDEFVFVTNGKFGDNFNKQVADKNIEIAKDYVKHTNLLHNEFDSRYLTKGEKQSMPAGKISETIFSEDNKDILADFVKEYKIPQIDICQYVTFPET